MTIANATPAMRQWFAAKAAYPDKNALTAFFGETGASLAAGGDGRTDRIAETLRDWADRARRHGVAAVYESANLAGMGRRVLGRTGGARQLTDLAHLADLLQTAVHRDGLSLPALADLLRDHPAIGWVQLPWAGVEPFIPIISAERERTWSCAKGVYSDPVAEHALALLLAGFRHLAPYARADTWTRDAGRNLFGAQITIPPHAASLPGVISWPHFRASSRYFDHSTSQKS